MLCRCLHEAQAHKEKCRYCECAAYHQCEAGRFALLAFTFDDGNVRHEYRFWLDTRLGVTVNNYADYFLRIAKRTAKKAETCGHHSWLIREFCADNECEGIKITDL